jgi:hypothetical protein
MAIRFRWVLRLLPLIAGAATAVASAEDAPLPRLYTNEALIEDVTRKAELAIDDPIAVFAYVLGSLPEQVRVYPTENYYYFSFFLNGSRYSGNIRLPAADRDRGELRFEYFQDPSAWAARGKAHHTALGASQGIRVERIAPLLYRVSHGSKSVIFALEDLSKVRPPANAIGPDEEFLGPVIDESAIRFYLVYNSELKLFHYILDESSGIADELVGSKRTDRLLVGRRSGFAFYRDHWRDRRILIGVREQDSRLNTYFDGPFDQLPENFVEGEKLRWAIVDSDPAVKGEIDRFGNFADGRGRYLIHPYTRYRTRSDLYALHRCATRRRMTSTYYNCFASNDDGRGGLQGHAVRRESGAARR